MSLKSNRKAEMSRQTKGKAAIRKDKCPLFQTSVQ